MHLGSSIPRKEGGTRETKDDPQEGRDTPGPHPLVDGVQQCNLKTRERRNERGLEHAIQGSSPSKEDDDDGESKRKVGPSGVGGEEKKKEEALPRQCVRSYLSSPPRLSHSIQYLSISLHPSSLLLPFPSSHTDQTRLDSRIIQITTHTHSLSISPPSLITTTKAAVMWKKGGKGKGAWRFWEDTGHGHTQRVH